jgi:glucose/arabinose dehydrogenase
MQFDEYKCIWKAISTGLLSLLLVLSLTGWARGQTAAPTTTRVQLELITSNLNEPVGLANAGDGTGRLFVVERDGRILIAGGSGTAHSMFLDIRDRVRSVSSEQGLLGLAFHPNFIGNGFFYVNYTDSAGNTKISRFTASTVAGPTPPGSERVILTINQPASNHNGGHLAFGPDGYLYIGTGDGGGGGDTFRNGQNGQTLLGAILRLDVDSAFPFAIPADNPFVGIERLRNEIWALGLRNPWRYAFDRLTGDLYIADVGQSDYEEVNIQPASSMGGENYGWPVMEGRHCFPSGTTCSMVGLTLPILEYDHSQGCSITGGHVYRGVLYPPAAGIYVFGDFCTGRIWGLFPSDGSSRALAELGRSDIRITSFGEDESGEIYVVGVGSAGGGQLYRLRFFEPIALSDN